VLGAIDPALKNIVDYGFFGWIAQLLLLALKFFYGFLKNYGLAIILLTVIIKVLFFPLTYKSLISMEKMKALQPKVKQINEKYKKIVRDPQLRREMSQKKNEELMALYRKEGVNPAGGCLPLLLQMPVLWAMYRLLSVAIELRHAPFFLWIKDLSAADPYLILPIVMGVSMIAQQVMTPSSADPRQKKMFYIMSVMFTYFFLYLPSGLVLYWLVNNILSILQQWIINKRTLAKQEAEKEAEKEAKRLKKALRQQSSTGE
jgi:YidC/Oxa1 family membrane protein insertase